MKKTIAVLGVLVSLISSVAFAGELPEKLEQTFKRDFPSAQTVVWEKKNDLAIAAFTENKTKYQAFYNPDANLIAVTRYITAEQMPVKLFLKLKTEYGNFGNLAVVEVSSIESDTFYMLNVYHKNKIKTLKVFSDGNAEVIKTE